MIKNLVFIAFLTVFSYASIVLTDEEQAFVQNNPSIRVHNEMNWAPFNFNENGTPKGLSIEMMNLIAQKVGLKIEYISGPSWNEFIEMMKDGSLDVMLNIVQNDSRDKFLLFTTVFQLVPHCIVTRNDSPHKYTKYEDILDKTVAVENGFVTHNYIASTSPSTKLVLRDDTLAALQAVSFGEADLTVGILATEAHTIKKNGLNNLKIIGISDDKLFAPKELKIATSKNNPVLRNILQKGLDALSDDEKQQIQNRWVSVDVDSKIDWELIGKIVAFFALIISMSSFYLYRLNRLQKRLSASNNLLSTMLDAIPFPIFHKDKFGRFTGFNEAYKNFFGIDTKTLIGTTVLEAKHLSKKDREIYNQEDMDTIRNSSYLIREQDMAFHDGKIHTTLYSIKGFRDIDGKPAGLIGVFSDISELKSTQEALKYTMKEIEELHKQTKDSIEFAALIQHSLTPKSQSFRDFFGDYFVIWHPKDVVGGDIYFFEEINSGKDALLIVADCTGHGVPGAFVTMMVKAIEKEIVSDLKKGRYKPDTNEILQKFNREMKSLLKQDTNDGLSNAGFDGAVLYINKESKTIEFSGANTPLYYVQNGTLNIIKGDRESIGYKKSKDGFVFSKHTIKFDSSSVFYITTDGFIDQNGGKNGFPFGKARFTRLIDEYSQESMSDQQEVFLDALYAYQQKEPRNDDIMFIGFRILEGL